MYASNYLAILCHIYLVIAYAIWHRHGTKVHHRAFYYTEIWALHVLLCSEQG